MNWDFISRSIEIILQPDPKMYLNYAIGHVFDTIFLQVNNRELLVVRRFEAKPVLTKGLTAFLTHRCVLLAEETIEKWG